MKLYPSEMLTIEIPEPVSVVIKRLRAATEAPRAFRRSHDHPPFEGWIREDSFEISRIIHYRNSFLPIIEGRIVPLNGHTRVHARIAVLRSIVALAYGLILVLSVFGVVVFRTNGDRWFPAAIGVIFVTFTAIIYVSGWSEIQAAKRLLRETLLQAPSTTGRLEN